jgi:two-component system, OmpR family, alkaline phosphatase synthesis response regulator PhoP
MKHPDFKNKIKRKICIVEDDDNIREIYSMKLKGGGYDVSSATNGAEGLDLIRQIKPDLILLDLIMPVKDGFETLKELKADPELKGIKIIILSNLSQEEDKQKVIEMGAVDYMVKANVSFREILDLIKKHLEI